MVIWAFEDDVLPTFGPDETGDEVQVYEATKIFDNLAALVCHQHSIDITRFFEKFREIWGYHDIE